MPSPRRPTEPAPEALLRKLLARGYEILQGPEIEAYLDARAANAATFLQGDLLLRPDPRRLEVLEEYLHNVQHRIGLTDRMSMSELERHVKHFMLRHRTLLGINADDAAWLATWLDAFAEGGP
jgi:hypothetical protein